MKSITEETRRFYLSQPNCLLFYADFVDFGGKMERKRERWHARRWPLVLFFSTLGRHTAENVYQHPHESGGSHFEPFHLHFEEEGNAVQRIFVSKYLSKCESRVARLDLSALTLDDPHELATPSYASSYPGGNC